MTRRSPRRSAKPTITFGGPKYARSYITINDALRDLIIAKATELGVGEAWVYVLDVDDNLALVIGPEGLASRTSGIPIKADKPARASRLALVEAVKGRFNIQTDKVKFTLKADDFATVNYNGMNIAVFPLKDYVAADAEQRNDKGDENQLEIPFPETQEDGILKEAVYIGGAFEAADDEAVEEVDKPADNDIFFDV
ncbi:MAG: hypothetical protein D6746_05110 [Bacteroidetes bacterium]|nr:MAG: hypothetical protein D6746_05110 [Bacteroidota bacterium]